MGWKKHGLSRTTLFSKVWEPQNTPFQYPFRAETGSGTCFDPNACAQTARFGRLRRKPVSTSSSCQELGVSKFCEVFVWWVFIKSLIPHEDHHPRWDETNTSSQLYCELSWLQLPHFSAGSDASSLAILTCSPWWRARNLETWDSKEPWCSFSHV